MGWGSATRVVWAGARRVPPEDCEGPASYLRLRDARFSAAVRLAEIVGELLDRDPTDRLGDISELREKVRGLAVYVRLDDFDRTAINDALGNL